MKKYILTYLMILTSFSIFASDSAAISFDSTTILLMIIMSLISILLIVLLMGLLKLSKKLFQTEEEKAYEQEFKNQTFVERIFDLNPISYEEKLLIEHEYDGIRELNNPTPPWFNFLFYGTIIIGLMYGIYYYVLDFGMFQDAEYQQEMTIATKQREEAMKKFANSINENNVKLLADAKSLEEGHALYTKNCVACHGAEAQGGVGPNLTDEYWLHGGGIKKVFRTITVGVPQKGMIAWQKQFNPLQIQQVASYVLSLKGTNPPNPKKAEGDLLTN